MNYLNKAKDLAGISIDSVNSSTNSSCKELILAISASVDKNLNYCDVVSISHSDEVKAIIKNKTSKVALKKKENPGNDLSRRDEPKELHLFSYDQLKKAAKLNNGIYRGKLYGTIESFSCPIKVNCPDCSGSGICNRCDGEKQVRCTVCDGNLECVSCDGTGKYTCTNCEGDGICPDCNDGWVECEDCNGEGTVCCPECNGDGTVYCPDCNGSGNYIDEPCNKCGGSGYYRGDTECRACGGTGRYVVECRRCDGDGTIDCDNCDGDGTVDCDNCDGDGGWDCKSCHGSGKCSHCRGKGFFICKACGGSGECGKCKGKGKIWCPDCYGKGKCFNCKGDKLVTCNRCNGTGKYQSYIEYSFTDGETTDELFSLPIDKKDISSISGELCYKDVIYDFFAKRANIYNPDSAVNSLNGSHIEILKSWLSLEHNSPFSKGIITNDFLNTYVEIYKIPVTKVVLRHKSNNFSFWIVGYNLSVFYENLPNFGFLDWVAYIFR